MGDTVEFRPARAQDAADLAPRLRASDVAELAATSGRTPLQALTRCASLPGALAAVERGRVFCLFGCAPGGTLLAPYGIPWLLAAPEIDRHAKLMLRAGRHAVGLWAHHFARLENLCAIEGSGWLRRIGFTVGEPFASPINGAALARFTKG